MTIFIIIIIYFDYYHYCSYYYYFLLLVSILLQLSFQYIYIYFFFHRILYVNLSPTLHSRVFFSLTCMGFAVEKAYRMTLKSPTHLLNWDHIANCWAFINSNLKDLMNTNNIHVWTFNPRYAFYSTNSIEFFPFFRFLMIIVFCFHQRQSLGQGYRVLEPRS
jgi:hypothetical protein